MFQKTAEVFLGNCGSKQLPELPKGKFGSSLVMHYGSILLCGRLDRKCYQWNESAWKEHSTFNQERVDTIAVSTSTATFVFGGQWRPSRFTYEYLPKDSTTWQLGNTMIPDGFWDGCVIAVKSEKEIWLIGGYETEKRILRFDVKNHTFRRLSIKLNVGRRGHRCDFIPGTNKVMITGGLNGFDILDSTEILDIEVEDGSLTLSKKGMNMKRSGHGIGIVKVSNEDKLAVFGGLSRRGEVLKSVEVYDSKTKKWKRTKMELKEERAHFGFLSVKLGDVYKQF